MQVESRGAKRKRDIVDRKNNGITWKGTKRKKKEINQQQKKIIPNHYCCM